MKKSILCGALVMIGAGGLALAGFKVKLVKPKKPDKFQVQVTADRIIYAADLLLEAKEQKKYFYKELASANIVAVRLAVFNQGAGDVVLPLQGIQLLGLDGEEIPLVDPLTVADAILQGRVVSAGISKNPKVAV
ncbi:MAG: hypothetical protein FJW35_08510, partial [Acidobacteria bacterium]|nr:hypothetical protein [Acidobacteriota bacterium]